MSSADVSSKVHLKRRALMVPGRCCFPQVVSFLRKKAEFVDLVLKHLETSAMMDLLLRLVSCVEPAPLRQEVLQVGAPALPPLLFGAPGLCGRARARAELGDCPMQRGWAWWGWVLGGGSSSLVFRRAAVGKVSLSLFQAGTFFGASGNKACGI